MVQNGENHLTGLINERSKSSLAKSMKGKLIHKLFISKFKQIIELSRSYLVSRLAYFAPLRCAFALATLFTPLATPKSNLGGVGKYKIWASSLAVIFQKQFQYKAANSS